MQSNIILKDKVAVLNLTFNIQMYFVIAEIKIVVSRAEKIIWSNLTFCFFYPNFALYLGFREHGFNYCSVATILTVTFWSNLTKSVQIYEQA